MRDVVHILAISGSLRAGSSNTSLLEAAARLAAPDVSVDLYEELGALPHFNPDLDTADGVGLPPIITDLRTRVGRADALLLSTPEYAHGLPGSFKNLLDWLVGSIEFPGKPVAVLSPSARSTHAREQLHEILRTMSATIVESACVVVTMPRETDVDAVVASPERSSIIRDAMGALVSTTRMRVSI